jgi:hypothetical protein
MNIMNILRDELEIVQTREYLIHEICSEIEKLYQHGFITYSLDIDVSWCEYDILWRRIKQFMYSRYPDIDNSKLLYYFNFIYYNK